MRRKRDDVENSLGNCVTFTDLTPFIFCRNCCFFFIFGSQSLDIEFDNVAISGLGALSSSQLGLQKRNELDISRYFFRSIESKRLSSKGCEEKKKKMTTTTTSTSIFAISRT